MSLVLKNLQPGDVSYTSFNAYKSWNNTISYLDQVSGSSNVFNYIWLEGKYSASFYPTVTHSISTYLSASVGVPNIWYHMNYLFYSNFYSTPYDKGTQVFQSFIQENRYLHDKVAIIAIPQRQLGTGIKPKSVTISTVNSGSVSQSFVDDGLGNLVASNPFRYFTESFSNVIEINFNDAFPVRYASGTFNDEPTKNLGYTSRILLRDKSKYKYKLLAKNILFTEPYFASNSTLAGLGQLQGTQATFNTPCYSESYVRMQHNNQINFDIKDEYSVLVSCIAAPIQKSNSANIIAKNGKRRDSYFVYENLGDTILDVPALGPYPYTIEINSASGLIYGKISDGNTVLQTSCSYTSSTELFIGLVKYSGSLTLYCNTGSFFAGTTSSIAIPSNFNSISNKSDLFIGNRGDGSASFSGSINYVLIFPRALSTTNFTQSSWNSGAGTSSYTTNEVNEIALRYKRENYQIGNVFYKQGLILLTAPVSSSDTLPRQLNIAYKSTKKINELEIICTTSPSEFSFSTNPTIYNYMSRYAPVSYTEVSDLPQLELDSLITTQSLSTKVVNNVVDIFFKGQASDGNYRNILAEPYYSLVQALGGDYVFPSAGKIASYTHPPISIFGPSQPYNNGYGFQDLDFTGTSDTRATFDGGVDTIDWNGNSASFATDTKNLVSMSGKRSDVCFNIRYGTETELDWYVSNLNPEYIILGSELQGDWDGTTYVASASAMITYINENYPNIKVGIDLGLVYKNNNTTTNWNNTLKSLSGSAHSGKYYLQVRDQVTALSSDQVANVALLNTFIDTTLPNDLSVFKALVPGMKMMIEQLNEEDNRSEQIPHLIDNTATGSWLLSELFSWVLRNTSDISFVSWMSLKNLIDNHNDTDNNYAIQVELRPLFSMSKVSVPTLSNLSGVRAVAAWSGSQYYVLLTNSSTATYTIPASKIKVNGSAIGTNVNRKSRFSTSWYGTIMSSSGTSESNIVIPAYGYSLVDFQKP